MTTKHYYFTALSRKQQIYEINERTLKAELADQGKSRIEELSDYERRFFKSLDDCNDFLDDYDKAMELIQNGFFCIKKDIPCLIYKRHYLVLTALKIKNQTFRSYRKSWNIGQLINLYDQKHYVTVRIKAIDKVGNQFRYDFELMRIK